MSLRRRLVLLTVAVAVVLAGLTTYLVVRQDLRSGVDSALRDLVPQVSFVQAPSPGEALDSETPLAIELPDAPLGGASGVAQAVTPSGEVIAPRDAPRLPTDRRTREVAQGRREPFVRDTTVDGVDVRLFTRGLAGDALVVAKPLTEVENTLSRLRWILLAVSLAGIGLAAGLGVLVARVTAAPVMRLTGAAERVTATGDLGHRIDTQGEDELARWPRRSTRCSRRSSAPRTRSASSSPTRRTSCAHR